MQQRSMLIDDCGRLGAAIAIHAVEVKRGDAVLAESALERGAAIHRFGRVVSHSFNCSPLPIWSPGQ